MSEVSSIQLIYSSNFITLLFYFSFTTKSLFNSFKITTSTDIVGILKAEADLGLDCLKVEGGLTVGLGGKDPQAGGWYRGSPLTNI